MSVRRFDVYCTGGWDGCVIYQDDCDDGELIEFKDYADLLSRHNALREAAKGLIVIHRRHKDLTVYSDQDYMDIWRERVDALAALVGEGEKSERISNCMGQGANCRGCSCMGCGR